MSTDVRLELANKLINLPAIRGTMEQTIGIMLDQFQQLPMLFQPTPDQWRRLGEGIIDALRSDLGAVYASNMTEDELRFVLAFYENPLGVQVMSKLSAMMPMFAELGALHGNRIAQRIIDGDAGVFVN
jgi:hypothetical protein